MNYCPPFVLIRKQVSPPTRYIQRKNWTFTTSCCTYVVFYYYFTSVICAQIFLLCCLCFVTYSSCCLVLHLSIGKLDKKLELQKKDVFIYAVISLSPVIYCYGQLGDRLVVFLFPTQCQDFSISHQRVAPEILHNMWRSLLSTHQCRIAKSMQTPKHTLICDS